MSEILLLISLILLSASKLADLWTTVHHVGRYGETNPLARFLFAKVGFAGGLALVMVLWAVIVGVGYASAWSAPWWIQVVTAITGTFIAWIQWDVARFNATRKTSRLTRIVSAQQSTSCRDAIDLLTLAVMLFSRLLCAAA